MVEREWEPRGAELTTETQRAQRKHREEQKEVEKATRPGAVCRGERYLREDRETLRARVERRVRRETDDKKRSSVPLGERKAQQDTGGFRN